MEVAPDSHRQGRGSPARKAWAGERIPQQQGAQQVEEDQGGVEAQLLGIVQVDGGQGQQQHPHQGRARLGQPAQQQIGRQQRERAPQGRGYSQAGVARTNPRRHPAHQVIQRHGHHVRFHHRQHAAQIRRGDGFGHPDLVEPQAAAPQRPQPQTQPKQQHKDHAQCLAAAQFRQPESRAALALRREERLALAYAPGCQCISRRRKATVKPSRSRPGWCGSSEARFSTSEACPGKRR